MAVKMIRAELSLGERFVETSELFLLMILLETKLWEDFTIIDKAELLNRCLNNVSRCENLNQFKDSMLTKPSVSAPI